MKQLCSLFMVNSHDQSLSFFLLIFQFYQNRSLKEDILIKNQKFCRLIEILDKKSSTEKNLKRIYF